MHSAIGLEQIALVVTVALSFGLVLERFKQPVILGYIAAGIFLGPSGGLLFKALGLSGHAYVENGDAIQFCADLGVLMVLFVVGMSLDLQSFKRAMGVSIATMLGQLLFGLLVAFALNLFFGWGLGVSLLLAFVLALSSTAVAVKMLEVGQEVNTDAGRVALGILIAQDLAIVPMILVLKDLDHGIQWASLGLKIGLAMGILTFLVWFLGRPRRVTGVLRFTSQSPELPSLLGLSFCFGFATLSGYLGLSLAYGAFLAGLVLGNIREHTLIKQMVMPIYSVLVMVFFLSVGLLIDLSFIWHNVFVIVVLSLVIIIFKTTVNLGLLRLFRQPWPTAFLAGVALSQLGEFSFLLISEGSKNNLLGPGAQKMLITLTAISLAISPLWLALARRLRAYHIRSGASFDQTLRVYGHLVGGGLVKAYRHIFYAKPPEDGLH